MWTKEQDRLVLEQELSDQEIAQIVGRTVQAVHSRRFALHHKYPNRDYGSRTQKPWSSKEEAVALDWSLSDKEVAEALGRTLNSVKYKRRKLREKEAKPTRSGKWSPYEINLIMTSDLSDSELAKVLHRTKQSIASKRYHTRYGNHGTVITQ